MTILPIEPPNPIFSIEPQLKEKYPDMNGITAWKDTRGVWIYHFDSIPDTQQNEVLAYARTLAEIP